METLSKLGKLIGGDEGRRDAVHIAVVPLIAGEVLYPGDKFRLKFGTTDVAVRSYDGHSLGVVDPFIDRFMQIDEGQIFWAFLDPGTITGLRHHWRHPAFDDPVLPENEHERWLMEFCARGGMDYAKTVEVAMSDEGGRHVLARGKGADDLDPGEESLFWHHLEALKGVLFSAEHKQKLGWVVL